MKFEKKYWLTKNSNIPMRFHGWDFSKVDEIPEAADQWLDSAINGEIIMNSGGLGFCGVGLAFTGAPGIGKTSMAAIILNEFVSRLPETVEEISPILKMGIQDIGVHARPVYYLTYPEFLRMQKATWELEDSERVQADRKMASLFGLADNAENVRILVLDDLGKEYNTQFASSTFDELLRVRYDNGLPTIITTNLELSAFADKYSEAMGSFVYEAFIPVELQQKKDRRR